MNNGYGSGKDTIQNALKRLFCSIGGNADNVRNKDDINAILDEMTALKIGEEISGGGTNVVANPTLAGTEADLEGLQVGDTKYKVGGGGGALVVTLTTHEEVITAGKTAGEIASAISNGSNVLFYEPEGGAANYYPLTYAFVGEGEFTFAFIADLDLHTPVYLYASSADDYPTNGAD